MRHIGVVGRVVAHKMPFINHPLNHVAVPSDDIFEYLKKREGRVDIYYVFARIAVIANQAAPFTVYSMHSSTLNSRSIRSTLGGVPSKASRKPCFISRCLQRANSSGGRNISQRSSAVCVMRR